MRIATTIQSSGKNCEDRLGVFDEPGRLVVVVADGAGGIGGGAEAADTALRLTREAATSLSSPDECCKLLYQIDQVLSQHPSGGQTTCVVAGVTSTELYGASVGDSAAWLIGEGSLKNLTEHQLRKPFLGCGIAQPVPFKHTRGLARLLLATDGLIKYTSQERICDCAGIEDLNDATTNMVGLIRYPSGELPDDVAIILVDLNP